MKKRWITSLLTAVMIITLCQGFSAEKISTAAASSGQYKKETMILTNIMEGYSLNKIGSSTAVTRGQFAQMLVNASSFQGQAETSLKTSLYKDVSRKNKYAGYIKIAVEQGWMSANVKGKFRPNEKVLVKDAAKAILTMLGYTKSDFSGNLVNAQVSKFNNLGLNDKIKKTKNQGLTFANCTNLFYQLLGTKTKNDMFYGVVLGYAMDSDGNIDYLKLLQDNLEGPVLLTSSLAGTIPFNTSGATVYRDDAKSQVSSITAYDVLYYSKELKTIWAYSEKITGTVEAISPNRTSPDSVTVNGTSYALGNQDVIYAFSSLGEFGLHKNVTLFLGMDDKVVAVLNTSDYNTELYGVVLEYGISLNSVDGSATNRYLTMVDTNGNKSTHYYNYGSLSIEKGDLIHVEYTSGLESIKKAAFSDSSLSGKTVTASSNQIGSYSVSSSLKIVDVHDATYRTLTLNNIDGVVLSASNIYYYKINGSGEVTSLILKGVSSSSSEYCIITDISSKTNITAYEYLVNGQLKTTTVNEINGDILLDVGSRIDYNYDSDDVLESVTFSTLSAASVTGITSTAVKTDKWTKNIDSNVNVYYIDGEGKYTLTTVSKILDLSKYTLTAYYDTDSRVAQTVRIIIAKPR